MGIERKKVSEAVFSALDLETTGINPITHKIVEVGIIRFTLSETIDSWHQLVNPGVPIPREATSIHGISNRMVKGAPGICDILDNISAMIRDTTLVIHNASFDLAFLSHAYRRCGHDMPYMEAVDTIRLARRSYPDFSNYNLGSLCQFLGIDIHHHRAISDAEGCMELFRNIVSLNDSRGKWLMDDLKAFHGEFTRPDARMINITRIYRNRAVDIEVGRLVKIKYADSSGVITTREILPEEILTYGKRTYIYAYCHLRQAKRYFNSDRIIEIF